MRFNSSGLKEKKATSEPDIKAEVANSKTKTISELISSFSIGFIKLYSVRNVMGSGSNMVIFVWLV